MFQRKQRDSYLQKGIDLTAHSSRRFQKGHSSNLNGQGEAGPSSQKPTVNGLQASRSAASSGFSSSTAASRARTMSVTRRNDDQSATDRATTGGLVRNTTTSKPTNSEPSTKKAKAKESSSQQASKSNRDVSVPFDSSNLLHVLIAQVDGDNKGAGGQRSRAEDHEIARRGNVDGNVKVDRDLGKRRHDNASQKPSSRHSQRDIPPVADPGRNDDNKRNSFGGAIAETLVSFSQKIMGSFG